MRFLSSALPVAALAFCGSNAEATDLKFGWQPGMTCKVIHSVDTMRRDKKTVTFSMKTSAAAGELLLVEVMDLKLPVAAAPAGTGPESLLPLLLPDFNVKVTGEIAGIKDLEKSRAAWRQLINGQFSSADKAKAEQVFEIMGSEAMVENTVRLLWNPMISAWAGSSWEADEHFVATQESTFPIGNLPYKSVVDAHFVGMRPCSEKTESADCALLRTEQKPDPEAFKGVVKQIMSKFGGNAEEVSSVKLDLRMYSEVLTHPATLVPVSVRAEKHMTMSGMDKGKPFDFSGKEVRDWKFACDRT